jgi:hypothetical protein
MAVHLYHIRVKTNDGPWTQPSNYTGEELGTVVDPYSRFLYGTCKGIIGRPTVYFDGSDKFVRKYNVDTIENAQALYRTLNDMSIPEVKAMRKLAKKKSDDAGTTYETIWKLTQDAEHQS